jgi:limonene 1,2-monooxygenase
VRREDWRMVVTMHLAESREEAMRQVREWGNEYLREYAVSTSGLVPKDYPEQPLEEFTIDRLIGGGTMVVGTPDDAIAKIRELDETSGGIGGVLNMVMDWGTRDQQERSYELFARHVMPAFQGSTESIAYSNRWSRERRDMLMEKASGAVAAALAQVTPTGNGIDGGGQVRVHPAQSASQQKSAK